MAENNFKRIDITPIYNGAVSEIPFSFEISPENTEYLDLCFQDTVKVSGKVYEKARGTNKAEGYVALDFSVKGTYLTHCARCACELKGEISVEKSYGITKKLFSDSEDIIEVPDGYCDVYELAEAAFYLELPSRVLCKEDCKGLCQVCGIDLNFNECNCNKTIKRNSLEDLKKLLDN